MSNPPTQDERRQTLIDELQALEAFDQMMLMRIWQQCVAVGVNPGQLRIATYQQWKMEVASFAKEQGMSEDQAVVLGLFSRFDLYGLGYLVQDARKVGIELTYARFLESAFQWATKIGDAYERCICGLSWKNVYLTLKSNNWTPAV